MVKVPTALVVDIERDAGSGSAQVRELQNAIGELKRGNLAEARRALKVLSGGGYKQNLESGRLEYQSFAANDPPGKRTRPTGPASTRTSTTRSPSTRRARQRGDKELLEQAYLALVDQPDPDGRKDEKGKPLTTGGFLTRFEGGNSRWYADAMTLAAQTLVGLGRLRRGREACSRRSATRPSRPTSAPAGPTRPSSAPAASPRRRASTSRPSTPTRTPRPSCGCSSPARRGAASAD